MSPTIVTEPIRACMQAGDHDKATNLTQTRLICTLGPSSCEVPVLEELLRTGMKVRSALSSCTALLRPFVACSTAILAFNVFLHFLLALPGPVSGL